MEFMSSAKDQLVDTLSSLGSALHLWDDGARALAGALREGEAALVSLSNLAAFREAVSPSPSNTSEVQELLNSIEQYTHRLHAGQVVHYQGTLLTPVMVARPCDDVRFIAFPTSVAARLTTGLVLPPNSSADTVVLGFRKAGGDCVPPALAVLDSKQVLLLCGAETQWRLHVVVLSQGTNEKHKGLDYLILQTAALCKQLFSEGFDKNFEDSPGEAAFGSDPWKPAAGKNVGGGESNVVSLNLNRQNSKHEGGEENESLAGGIGEDALIPGSASARDIASGFLFAEQSPVPLEEDRRAVLQIQVTAWSSEVKIPLRTGDPDPCEAHQMVTCKLAVYAWAKNEGKQLLGRAVAVGALFWGPEDTPWRTKTRNKPPENPFGGPRECLMGSGKLSERSDVLPERRRGPPGWRYEIGKLCVECGWFLGNAQLIISGGLPGHLQSLLERLRSGNDVSNDRLTLAKLGAAPGEQSAYAAALARLDPHGPWMDDGFEVLGAEEVEVTSEITTPWKDDVKERTGGSLLRLGCGKFRREQKKKRDLVTKRTVRVMIDTDLRAAGYVVKERSRVRSMGLDAWLQYLYDVDEEKWQPKRLGDLLLQLRDGETEIEGAEQSAAIKGAAAELKGADENGTKNNEADAARAALGEADWDEGRLAGTGLEPLDEVRRRELPAERSRAEQILEASGLMPNFAIGGGGSVNLAPCEGKHQTLLSCEWYCQVFQETATLEEKSPGFTTRAKKAVECAIGKVVGRSHEARLKRHRAYLGQESRQLYLLCSLQVDTDFADVWAQAQAVAAAPADSATTPADAAATPAAARTVFPIGLQELRDDLPSLRWCSANEATRRVLIGLVAEERRRREQRNPPKMRNSRG